LWLWGWPALIRDFLYTVGPARKGRLWETTAVPEIRGQIAELAERLANACRSSSSGNSASLMKSKPRSVSASFPLAGGMIKG
jgi:uncharacterized NAD(P)/FAD-binding protein YdhS